MSRLWNRFGLRFLASHGAPGAPGDASVCVCWACREINALLAEGETDAQETALLNAELNRSIVANNSEVLKWMNVAEGERKMYLRAMRVLDSNTEQLRIIGRAAAKVIRANAGLVPVKVPDKVTMVDPKLEGGGS